MIERLYEMMIEAGHGIISGSRVSGVGLRAGQVTCISRGALDYVFHTAHTLREGIRVLQRSSELTPHRGGVQRPWTAVFSA
jgi:hypothetical protein